MLFSMPGGVSTLDNEKNGNWNGEKRHSVKDRVLCKVLFNNPGHHKPGDKIPGTVIAVFGEIPVYRVELDTVWAERMDYSRGKKIVMGNVTGGAVSRLDE